MKKLIYRILLLVAIAFLLNAIEARAQVVNNSNVDDEIKTLNAEIKAKQKRILELKLQKLKQQQEEIQNELKSLENSDGSSVSTEAVSPNDVKIITVSKKQLVTAEPPKQETSKVVTAKVEIPKPIVNAVIPAQNQSNDPKCNNITITSRSTFDNKLCVLSTQFQASNTPKLMDNPDELVILFMQLAQTDENIKNFILQFENKRTDKQIGGDSTSKGTTSLAVKGGVPRVIGWAIENGAATSTISGNTVNIRVNPIGLLDSLAQSANPIPLGNRFISSTNAPTHFLADTDDNFTKFAKRASVGFSFDTTRGTDPPTFIGSKQQLSAVSFRYEFINHRNPLRTEFNDDWNKFFKSQIDTLTGQINAVSELVKFDTQTRSDVFINPKLKEWVDVTQAELENLPVGANGKRDLTAIREKIEERLKVLPIEDVLKDADLKQSLTNLAEAGAKFSAASKEFLNKLNKGTLVTFEYTNNREVNMPNTSNFNFIAEFGRKFGSGVMDITFNGSLTMFNKKPTLTNVKRIKDFNFALQADFPIPQGILGDSVLSFSGKYVRQQSDAVNPNGTVASNTKGDIAVGQIKLTIPIPDWGIRFPLSITFANRTDLVKESTVRGNFGITFDLDSMFGRKKIF